MEAGVDTVGATLVVLADVVEVVEETVLLEL